MSSTVFDEHRRHLFGIAYRMLGSAADADDMVQETFVRWQAANTSEIRSPRAFLTTVVTRISLDRLKEAHATRVDYVGPWLPEPLPTQGDDETDAVEAAEAISQAFLVLLESLTPLERAVHLLHDVFDYSHEEVAQIIGRDVAACRKILERARKDIVARRPRFAPSKEEHRHMLGQFAAAVTTGNASALEQLLADDVRTFSDGGGKAKAASKPLSGRTTVAKFYGGLARQIPNGTTAEILEVNGWPALIVRVDGTLVTVVQIETDGTAIYTIRATLNPEKLSRI
jgi:RNA polymerase sigma-70 factor (ECF subfamily)